MCAGYTRHPSPPQPCGCEPTRRQRNGVGLAGAACERQRSVPWGASRHALKETGETGSKQVYGLAQPTIPSKRWRDESRGKMGLPFADPPTPPYLLQAHFPAAFCVSRNRGIVQLAQV